MEIVVLVVYGLSAIGACLLGLVSLAIARKLVFAGRAWGAVGLFLLVGLGWAAHPFLIWNQVDGTWLLLLLGMLSIALTVGAFVFLLHVLGGY